MNNKCHFVSFLLSSNLIVVVNSNICTQKPSAFSLSDVLIPPMANVLKVFLENGQTKSFKYDSTTTVQVRDSCVKIAMERDGKMKIY